MMMNYTKGSNLNQNNCILSVVIENLNLLNKVHLLMRLMLKVNKKGASAEGSIIKE